MLVVTAACGPDDLPPLGIEEFETGDVVLSVDLCAENVTARVVETDDEVRISDVSGEPLSGDCLGGVELELAVPVGERRVVVDGDEWVRIDDDCELAYYAPPVVLTDGSRVVPRRCQFTP